MVEHAPQIKLHEQYPLLKADGGGGDGGVHQQTTPTLVTPGWGVTCSPKQSWIVRWPEYISACWMTLILLAISFLVFYTLALEAYRRKPILVTKSDSFKPSSDIYYHHIVQQGSFTPFMMYADYLSDMAVQYPSLHFHVFFLLDDSLQSAFRGLRHARFINKVIPYSASNVYPFSKFDDIGKQDIADFETRFQNVNVTIMSLGKYMAMTPLKYKWRTIPLAYITFYARVFSVWQNGGVAMDLNNFNNNYNNRKCVDRRISAILKQHNDGIQVEEYTNALNKIDREEENYIFTIFYGLMHQVLNETSSLESKSFPFPQITTEKVLSQNERLIRTNRNKQEIAAPINDNNNKSETISNVYVETINPTNDTDLKKNEYQTLPNSNVNLEKLKVTIKDDFKSLEINNSSVANGINKTEGLNTSKVQTEMLNKSDTPQVDLFYDFWIENCGKPGTYENSGVHLVSIDSEGMFVSASSRMHPFLGHLISDHCCQRMQPKLAIQDSYLLQCSVTFKEDTYCNNIYLL